MATSKQTQAAKRNVQKAQRSAAGKKTISHLPSRTPDRTWQARRGCGPAQAHRRHLAQDPRGTVRDGPATRPAGPVENGPR